MELDKLLYILSFVLKYFFTLTATSCSQQVKLNTNGEFQNGPSLIMKL